MQAEAAAEDRMPSTIRCFVSYLLGTLTVWPVDSVCVRPSLGLALGPHALVHILYDVYTSVYSRLLPSSL